MSPRPAPQDRDMKNGKNRQTRRSRNFHENRVFARSRRTTAQQAVSESLSEIIEKLL